MVAPIDKKHRKKMNTLAEFLDTRFNGMLRGSARKIGFTLLIFPLKAPGRMNYLCNANRADMIASMKQLISQWEGEVPEETEYKRSIH